MSLVVRAEVCQWVCVVCVVCACVYGATGAGGTPELILRSG